MTKRRAMLVAALILPWIWVFLQSKAKGADEDKKDPDSLQAAKAFLDFAFTGQAKAAADLGEPDKAYSREEKIKREFERFDAKKPPAIVRFLADEEHALAITDPVIYKEIKGKKQRGGPLSIRLVKKDKRWLIRDVDLGKGQADKNLERFQRERPKAKVLIPKENK